MAIYEPLRDSFREFNKMLIDKQQWDAQHELNVANQAIQNKMIEANLQDQQLRREVLMTQAEKARQYRTPQVFDLASMLGPDDTLLQNKEFISNMKRTLDDNDQYTWNPAIRQFVDANDEPLRISPLELERRLPAVVGMIDQYEDTPARVINAIRINEENIAQGKKNLAILKGDPGRNIADIAKQREIIKDHEEQLAFQESFFEPQRLISYYDEKQSRMRQAATWAQGRGLKELSAHFSKAADNFAGSGRVVLDKYLAASGLSGKGTWTKFPVYDQSGKEVGVAQMHSISSIYKFKGKKMAELPEGLTITKPSAEGVKDFGKAGLDFIEKNLRPRDQVVGLTPQQNSIAAVARNLFNDMEAKNPVKNYGHARVVGQKAIKQAKQLHEVWLNRLLAIEAARGTVEKGMYEAALAKHYQLAGKAMGYIPVMEFHEQIRQAGAFE
jgi:hypothetical protein